MTKQELQLVNLRRFIVPPSYETMSEFIKRCKLSRSAFERAFGIPRGTLRETFSGRRGLPTHYWHIFYEGNIPENPYRVKKTEDKTDDTFFDTPKKVSVIKKVDDDIIPPPTFGNLV